MSFCATSSFCTKASVVAFPKMIVPPDLKVVSLVNFTDAK